MKKWLTCLLTVLLVGALTLSAGAAGSGISVTDVQALPGDTVYLMVSLDESVTGNAMGITYTWDSAVLEALPRSSSWEAAGTLNDFDRKGGLGAWASSSAAQLQGDVCVLAFRVLENAAFTETEVTCTLLVKNSGETVGEYTAAGTITAPCEHTYGGWKDQGSAGHSRSCTLCGQAITESHDWDDGVTQKDPDDPTKTVKLYTCSICHGTKQTEIPGVPADGDQSSDNTEATLPTTAEDVPHTGPTAPTGETEPELFVPETLPQSSSSQSGGSQSGTSSTQDHSHSGSSSSQGGTTGTQSDSSGLGIVEYDEEDLQSGLIITDKDGDMVQVTLPAEESTQCTDPEHDHAHDHEHEVIGEADESSPVTAVVVIAVAVVLVGAAVFLVKKKR